MSSTGRNLDGNERRAHDFYETPPWLTVAILPHLATVGGAPQRILEPAAGSGAITRCVRAQWPAAVIHEFELTRGTDFLTQPPEPMYDLVITNPPYSIAREFFDQAWKFRRSPGSTVAMLLRLNFLGSQGRASWHREHMPSIYVTPRRPSFTGNGTDSIEYAWFVWNELEDPKTVTILETEEAKWKK